MRPRMVWTPYSHEFHHPAEACYAWLTDYSDRDPEYADGAILRARRVLERSPERVVMEVENEVLGKRMRGRAEVRLYPKELRYEARPLEGDGGGLHYTYQLVPLGADRTRIDVRYGHRARKASRWLRLVLARPLIRARVRRMWTGFARAMDADLAR